MMLRRRPVAGLIPVEAYHDTAPEDFSGPCFTAAAWRAVL
jgi:hypothetical protein